jgi:hypothetical protein
MTDQNFRKWDWPDAKPTVATLIILSVVALSVYLIAYGSSLDNHPGIMAILTGLTGTLTACLVTIIQFYFGSSQSSHSKDDTIAQMATNPPPPPAPSGTLTTVASPEPSKVTIDTTPKTSEQKVEGDKDHPNVDVVRTSPIGRL